MSTAGGKFVATRLAVAGEPRGSNMAARQRSYPLIAIICAESDCADQSERTADCIDTARIPASPMAIKKTDTTTSANVKARALRKEYPSTAPLEMGLQMLIQYCDSHR